MTIIINVIVFPKSPISRSGARMRSVEGNRIIVRNCIKCKKTNYFLRLAVYATTRLEREKKGHASTSSGLIPKESTAT